MVKVALFVRLEAKPGKEQDVENLLKNGLQMVQEETGTAAWFGIRLGRSTFGIFDAFPDEGGRQAHLAGKLAKALMEKAPDLLTAPPLIEEVEILGAKLPEARLWKATTARSKVGAVLGIAGVVAAGWFAARRYFAPSNTYEAFERAPVTTPM